MKKPVLVIKFGSASITTKGGEIDERIVLEIARQTAQLQSTYNIVLVSSGAVAAGKRFLVNYAGTLSERKAAAAIGNPLLVRKYSTYFKPFGIALAQSLCERQHFANRAQFLQLKDTYMELWKNNVIPIANENDVVSNTELKFSDNDELATMIGVGFDAEQILFSTSVPGVLDTKGNVVPEIKVIDKEALSLARKDKSSLGLGGMTSKLNFARLANQMGVRAVIFSMQTPEAIIKAVNGATGTVCHALAKKVSSRNKWLASGSIIKAQVKIDEGAVQAIKNRKSLLAVGVIHINQSFDTGEVFQIADRNGAVIAVAKAKIDVLDMNSIQKKKNVAIAHADNIVLM
ncbi:MAG: glutamate 5-kinase [Sphingobacterium sp.]|uniref:glutamate 5-kinase n=1 Tax=Sphingobacterium sp. JB170 TaxID=1434842 RepID=UPI00097EE2F0|nr:glutamate 5-kinase [Sphingobacterium sp. JB170]SJN24703.1 Glutamate 5-kinase / RNA-binding C-terminal domain PUA [Sphingobacterium sp. JB170]